MRALARDAREPEDLIHRNIGGYMASGGAKPELASLRAILLAILMVTGTLFVSSAMAADTDGDGTDDSVDDCPVAAGNSTLDRTGCPDRDGDGTSDLNDPWVMSTGGYQQDAYQSASDDYIMIRFNHDATQYATAENGGGWSGGTTIRIWDTATRTNLRTMQHGDGAADLDWSPDGQYVAILTTDNDVRVYDASDGSLYDTMEANGETAGELAFSPDGTMLAVAGYRDGNNGDGQVEIFDADTSSSTYGDVLETLNPGSTGYYFSVGWSPDGSRLVVGGYEAIYIIDTDTWGSNRTISNAFSSLNSVQYSPDGNMISACSAWGGSNARARVYDALTGAQEWSYTTSTSCNDAAWSPDSSQIAFSHTYYQADGASIQIFFSATGVKIDTLSAPRPGGCTSGGGGNNCGTIYGVDWHPDGNHIISAHGRNDEGVYHWLVDPDIDNDGYLNPDDAFPEDGTQWNDTDGDNYGDNPAPATEPDACPDVFGTSFIDVYGCPDADGDGYSDDGDAFDDDPYQWADNDGDGFPSNVNDPRDPNPYGGIDYFDENPTQWDDSDGDGYGDNPSGPNGDSFPDDPSQWWDTDGDGYGDNPQGNLPDICPTMYGTTSTPEARGCPDSDNDGTPDPQDDFPEDPFQDTDTDGDGFGDSQLRVDGDACPTWPGTSTQGNIYGCTDSDGDGWADTIDVFPEDPTQWVDSDGDGYGDNYTYTNVTGDELSDDTYRWGCDIDPGLIQTRIQNGDAFPDEPTQWSDTDGDGFGDNYKDNSTFRLGCWPGEMVEDARNSDAFPLRLTQSKDADRDGYGDNSAIGDYQPDLCKSVMGFSWEDKFGCPDSDEDGWSDTADACPYDPNIHLIGQKCEITSADVGESQAEEEDSSLMLYIMGGAIALMLALIFVALVAKQLGARKRLSEIRDMQAQEMAFNDEEQERRQKWIDHYLSTGEIEKAKELGYVEKAEWQVHMEQEAAEKAALPSLGDLLD